jgi:hypothetical protein
MCWISPSTKPASWDWIASSSRCERWLRDVLRPLALRASVSGLAFESVVDDAVPDRLIGDPLRIGQVLRNLAGNAIKFTTKARSPFTCGRIRVPNPSEAFQCHARFSVADTGIGIPRGNAPADFEPFTQADGSTTRKYGGTGLGLSICSGLVELMGGRIWVESEVGQGQHLLFHDHAGTARRKNPPACPAGRLPPGNAPKRNIAHSGGRGQQRQPTPGRAAAGARGAFGNHRRFGPGSVDLFEQRPSSI